MNCGGGSFKSQLKRADRSGARVAVIVGDDEAARRVAAVKALRGGKRRSAKFLSMSLQRNSAGNCRRSRHNHSEPSRRDGGWSG